MCSPAESPKGGLGSQTYIEDVYWRLSFVFQNFATFDQPIRRTATETSSWYVFWASYALFLQGRRLLYISAWAFCVARSRLVGNAKALRYGTSEGKIPTPSCIWIFHFIHFIWKTILLGIECAEGVSMIHVGRLIEDKLHEQGRTVTWFATQLCCTRPNVYKIFNKESIDTYLLWRISNILRHDFFHDLSEAAHSDFNKDVSIKATDM